MFFWGGGVLLYFCLRAKMSELSLILKSFYLKSIFTEFKLKKNFLKWRQFWHLSDTAQNMFLLYS